MMTIVTIVTLKQGCEPEWDDVMRQRLEVAEDRPGWISGQLTIPVDRLDQRAIVGVWETRAHWEAWHADPAFQETRERLEGLQAAPSETRWYEVVFDARGD
jgi:heme-degrading monooxygenase HmoA